MAPPDRDFNEKRDFLRMRIDTPAKVHISTENVTLSGICRDLSGGGLSVELDSELPVGIEVEVSIRSAHGHNPMLQAKAEIIRVSQPQPNHYLLGLKITHVND